MYALVWHFIIIYNGIYTAFGMALFLFYFINVMFMYHDKHCMWLLLLSSSGVSHNIQHPRG